MKELLRYVQPKGILPDLLASKGGRRLLVIGSAVCVWSDLEKVNAGDFEIMGINDFMFHAPFRLTYGATLHPEKLPGWGFMQAYEASHKAHQPMETMSIRQVQGRHVKHVWPIHRDGGTSGLFGAFLRVLMGYDLIVLAGIPCDDSPRYFDPPSQRHDQFGKKAVHDEWLRARDAIFQGKVRSLSGNTKEWLGGPP